MGQRRRRGERATGPGRRRKRTPLRQAGNSEKIEEEERNLEMRADASVRHGEDTDKSRKTHSQKNQMNMDLRLVLVKVRP